MDLSIEKFTYFDFYQEFEDRDIPVFYKGPLKPDVLAGIASFIEIALKNNPKEAKKVYKIFIELAQNISYYSAETSSICEENCGIGLIILEEGDENYIFYAGNKTRFEDVIPVLRKCTIINNLDRDGLRKFKREQRTQTPGFKGGGHIGLIQAALISGNPINFDVFYIDEEHCFLLLWFDIKKEAEVTTNTKTI